MAHCPYLRCLLSWDQIELAKTFRIEERAFFLVAPLQCLWPARYKPSTGSSVVLSETADKVSPLMEPSSLRANAVTLITEKPVLLM